MYQYFYIQGTLNVFSSNLQLSQYYILTDTIVSNININNKDQFNKVLSTKEICIY